MIASKVHDGFPMRVSAKLCSVVSDTEIGVVDEPKGGKPMNTDQASEYILQRMVDLIERRRR